MGMRTRKLFGTLALLGALAWGQTVAQAQEPTVSPETEGSTVDETGSTIGGSGDNVAVAISTKDGSSKFRVSFRIVRTSSDVVDQSNIAFAFASCEGCESIAIAFQVVLVSGEPSTVIPENYAIALNFECTDCETLASAYQFVLGVDGNVHFTSDGNRTLAEIRRAIRDLARSDLSIEEIQAELDLLANDLRDVLANELVSAGAPDVRAEEVEDDGTSVVAPTETPDGQPSPTPVTSSTSDPLTSPSPEATSGSEPSVPADQSPSPTPSPSPSSSPTPTPAVTASP